MTTISLKELHDRTGHWLRQVSGTGEIVITERGRPIARLVAPSKASSANPFLERKLVPGFDAIRDRPLGGPDSNDIISEGREDR